MKHIGLVTSRQIPRLSPSDQLLVGPLAQLGFSAEAVPWDTNSRWEKYDALILRSCWNYPDHYQGFLDWLKQIEILGVPMLNTPDIVRWNIHKSYLFDLAKKRIPIIPTVIKPAIGNRGKGVEYLIQPFMPEVANEGEYSFIFINKKFSHTILKKQNTISLVDPKKTLTTQATRVLHAVDDDLLYARVDGINKDGIFMLMELELIEPQLYFDYYPKAAEIFARAVVSKL